MLLLSIITLSTLFAFSNGLACFDNGDKEIGGSCYKFVSQQMTFNDARNWCHFQNPVTASYLAYVPNQFTGNFLASYARSAFGQNDGNFWIGLSRQNSSSPWLWDAGFPLVFTNFDGSQLGQNYAAESMVSTKWGTYGQDELKNFVCSYDPSAPPTFGPATALPETTARPIITTTAQNVPTTTATLRKSTFLFGYSTEFDPNVVRLVKDQIVQALTANPQTNVKFGDVRFDCNNGSVIYYHDDIPSFSASVEAHLPYRSLAYPDPSKKSDGCTVFNKFLNNPDIPITGSTVFFLTRRFGAKDACDTWRKDVTVNFIQSRYSPGQYSIGCFEEASDDSNGLIVHAGQSDHEDESSFPSVAEKMMGSPYLDNLLYAQSFYKCYNVTARQLASLQVPEYSDEYVNVTLAITTELLAMLFQSIQLTMMDKTTQKNTTLFYDRTDLLSDSDSIWKTIQLKSGSTSDVYMDYRSDWDGNVQIRMFIDKPVPKPFLDLQKTQYNSRPALTFRAHTKF